MKTSRFPRFSNVVGAFLATSLALSGCASSARYVYDLTPVSSNVSWRNGQAMSRCSESGWDVEAGFVGEEGGSLRFLLQVHNSGTDTVDLDPSQFRVMALLKDSLGRESRMGLYVYDREAIRPRIEEAIAKLESEENPYRVTGLEVAVGVVAGIAEIAGAFASKTPEQRREDELRREKDQDRRDQRERDEADWEAAHERKRNELRREKEFWTNKVIGRSTLAPGGSASGILVSSLHHEAIANDVEVRAGRKECRITFRQVSRKI